MDNDSLDRWIERLNGGDEEAVGKIFMTYGPALRIAVRRRLDRRLRAKVDSADIVQSVFADVLVAVRNGGWRFDGRSPLLSLLNRIARRRIADRYQKHRAALEREQSLGEATPGNQPQSPLPRPSQVAQGQEFWESVLEACPPRHQEIVRLRRSGLPLSEIAARTGLHEGSIRRILYDLARRLSDRLESDRECGHRHASG